MSNPKHRFAILPKVVAVRILCNIDQSGTAQSQKDVSEGGSGATCLTCLTFEGQNLRGLLTRAISVPNSARAYRLQGIFGPSKVRQKV